MSTFDPIAPDRLEALLRGESGDDGRERRIGALMDELTHGRDRAARRAARARALALGGAGRRRPRQRGACRASRACAVSAGASRRCSASLRSSQWSQEWPRRRWGRRRLARRRSRPRTRCTTSPLRTDQAGVATGKSTLAPAPSARKLVTPSAPLPDGQRAQDYAASLRLAVGSVAELSRSTQSVLDTVHSLGGAVVTVDYGTPSAGSGSALIDLRVPVGRAQEALRRFSALGTITAQQVQIRDLQAGLDQETNRARALRHRVELLKAKLLSPSLTRRRARDARGAPGRLPDSARERAARRARDAAARGVRPLLARSGHRPRHGDRAPGAARRRSSARRTTRSASSRWSVAACSSPPSSPARSCSSQAASGGSRGASGAALSGGCSRARDALGDVIAPGSEGRAGGDAEHPGEREPPDHRRGVLQPQARRAAGSARAAALEPDRDGCERDGTGHREGECPARPRRRGRT